MTTFRRRADGAYGIAVGAVDYLAFVEGGAGVVASLYHGGVYATDLAETSGLSIFPSRATLAESRYLICSNEETIEIWDLVLDTVSSYAVGAGKLIVGAAAVGGAVYWFEYDVPDWSGTTGDWSSTVVLRSAGYDLVEPVDVGSVDVEGSFKWEWSSDSTWFALSETAAMAQQRADDAINHEVQAHFRVRMPLSGTGGSFAFITGGSTPQIAIGIPESGGGAVAARTDGFEALAGVPDAVDGAVFDYWPETEEWVLALPVSVSSTPGFDAIALFGSDDEGQRTVVRNPAGTPAGDPVARFAVNDHPVHGPVELFFIFEP